MNIKELGEDLEQQFGKPRNITEENVRFMLSLIKEEFDGKKVNEGVEKPSLDAFGVTILAVMSYQTTPWEELAKKPSISKTLKYIAIRGGNHYDEIEALTKDLMRKHFEGINQKMILGFLKIIRGLSTEEQPSKLLEYIMHPAQYYAISHGLHQLVRGEHPDDAAAIIHCAIEDGILFPTIPRSLLADEFNLKKSSFDKVRQKLRKLPNSDYNQLWLQNITYQRDKKNGASPYSMRLCRIVAGEKGITLWNNDWLKPELASKASATSIIDKATLKKTTPVITFKETSGYDEIAL